MKRVLLLATFALSVLCISCSTEQKIDRLLNKAEKLADEKDTPSRVKKLAEIGEELESFDEKDFTKEQLERLEDIMSDLM